MYERHTYIKMTETGWKEKDKQRCKRRMQSKNKPGGGIIISDHIESNT